MRWMTFAIFAALFLVLETGLRALWSVGWSGHSPSLLLLLALYVALAAPMAHACWAALVLGILADLTLTWPISVGGETHAITLIGPSALGFLAAARVGVEMRGMIFRQSPFALAFVVPLAGAFAHLVIVALLTLRGLGLNPADPVLGWSAADQLLARCFDLIYTALVATPVGIALLWTDRLWGFQPHGPGPGRFRRMA